VQITPRRGFIALVPAPMAAVGKAEFGEFGRPPQVLPVSRRLVEVDKRVSVSGHPVAEAVALLQEAALPNDFSALSGNPGVNFTNILQAAFSYKFFTQLLCTYNLGL